MNTSQKNNIKSCAIHQPNFFPWLGYFDKINKADIFIFLDNVAYPKSGSGSGCWCNRVKLNVNKNATWVGCPIKREHGIQLIKDVIIDKSKPWKNKLLKTLAFNYKKSPNYEKTIELISHLLLFETENLAEFNINAIKAISTMLNIKTEFIRQSELNVEGTSTQLLINLTKAVNAQKYLCGGGAQDYQEDNLFIENNIALIYQNYVQEKYFTIQPFISGLSVIDYLMNERIRDYKNLSSL